MASHSRSVALRRMGITEWRLRQSDAPIATVVPGSEPAVALLSVSPVPVSSEPATTAAEATGPAGTIQVGTTQTSTVPITTASVAGRPSMAVTPPATSRSDATIPVQPVRAQAPAATPGLRGRWLTKQDAAPLLVLALAERNGNDNLLQLAGSDGALLNAMLASLSIPASIALFGVERGEPLTVPPAILVLGERSAKALLGAEVLLPLRGRVHVFGSSRVVVSYHPAELRQNSALKRLAWEDLRLLASLLAADRRSGS